MRFRLGRLLHRLRVRLCRHDWSPWREDGLSGRQVRRCHQCGTFEGRDFIGSSPPSRDLLRAP